MTKQGKLIRSSAEVVRIAMFATAVFGAALVAGLAASLTMGGTFTEVLLGGDVILDPDPRTGGMRWLMVLGLVMAGAIFAMLRALKRIIATVSAGDPFIRDNAQRLRSIGWGLLFLQLLEFPAGMIAHHYPALGDAAPDWGFAPAGWLAVLMLFVLARIFTVGAQMRDDLEGTV